MISPHIAPLYAARGEASRCLGRYGDAIEDFEMALILEPDNEEAHEALREMLGKY